MVAEIVEGRRSSVVLCKGGNGGWGNTHFKTSTQSGAEAREPGPRRRARGPTGSF
jgi:GTP-binding protein